MFTTRICLLTLSTLMIACGQKTTPVNNELTMVVGTYTDAGSKGIYTFRFSQEEAECTPLSHAEISNPSYLTISGNNKFVYAVSEHGNGQEAITAFGLNTNQGTLQFLNVQPAMGADPCYITTNGKNIVTANYSGGSVSVFPIATDGSLLPASDVVHFVGSGPDKDRQEKSHVHCVTFSPDGKFLFANDLGTDKIYKFNVNTQADAKNKEKLLEIGIPPAFSVTPESGPRHLTFTPDGNYAYLINELSGQVTAFQYKEGNLTEMQSIAADTVNARGSADIHVSPDGKFVYASTRLEADGVAIFKIDGQTGKLTKAGFQLTGKHPRNFIITPNGKLLLVACRDKNAIEVYQREIETGLLTYLDKDILLNKPVCIKFAH